jgi:hypothetical protein
MFTNQPARSLNGRRAATQQPVKAQLRHRPRLETPKELAQRNRRVVKIMTIVGNVATKSEVEEAIIFHDSHFVSLFVGQVRPGRHWIRTKPQKVAVKRVATALWRLKAALNQRDLIFTLQNDFPMTKTDLEDWCRRINQLAGTNLANPGRLNQAKRYAVESAAEFCRRYGVELRNGPATVSSVAWRKCSIAMAMPNFITTAVNI